MTLFQCFQKPAGLEASAMGDTAADDTNDNNITEFMQNISDDCDEAGAKFDCGFERLVNRLFSCV